MLRDPTDTRLLPWWIAPTLVLAIATAVTFVMTNQTPGFNGPWYWQWPWRELDWARVICWLLPGLALIGAGAALHRPSRLQTVLSLLLVMLGMLLLQLGGFGVQSDPFSLDGVSRIVEHPMHTSYFIDSASFALSDDVGFADLLASYPDFMPGFYMHAQNKPPGAILFFGSFIKALGLSHSTSLVAGLCMGALATLVVPASWWMIRTLTENTGAAFWGAVFVALCPGLVLHFPMMDQLYPAVTCVLVATWVLALRYRSAKWALVFGLAFALGCFFVYHFLTLGVVLVALAIVTLRESRFGWPQCLLRSVAIAVGAIICLYVTLGVFTGFNPVNTFLQALTEQKKHLADLPRPYPATVFWDLFDFALGFGWVALVPLLIALFCGSRKWTLVCLAQPVVVAITGIMQCETARTWCFMLPLVALPVGLEVSRWNRTSRGTFMVAMGWMVVVVCRNLTFMF